MSTLKKLGMGAVAVAALAAALVLGLPSSLGGATSYVATHGTSMEPRFHTGDLAIVRAADDVGVGDVVAYDSALMDTTVLHRIVAVRDGKYTFKGDNNSWLDPETPTEDQLIGRLVLRIPDGGTWLARLSSPPGLGALALAGLLPGAFVTSRSRRKRRKRTVSQHAHRGRRPFSVGSLSPALSASTLVAAVLVASGLGLAAFGWSGPTTRTVSTQQPSEREVTFSYTADVSPSAAYDDTRVTSPQPVFRAVADSVEVGYRYRGGPGAVSVVAELSTPSGWRSVVPLSRSHRFASGTYHGTVHLDLAALTRRADRAADVIGLPADQITVTVRPRFTGGAAGVFAPELALTLTPTMLSLAGDGSLRVEDSTSVITTTRAARTLSFADRELTASVARRGSLVLLGTGGLLCLLVALLARPSTPATQVAAQRRRFAHLLVAVEPIAAQSGRPTVDVADLPTLARLAERYGLLVLHWTRGGVETFLVQDEGATYRFRAGAPEAPADVSWRSPAAAGAGPGGAGR